MKYPFSKVQDVRKLADKMMAELLRDSVDALVAKHGGWRPAARAVDVDVAYLQRLRSGEKSNPSPSVMRKLGIVKERK